MADSLLKQIAGLKNLNHKELKLLYTTLHGSQPPAYNRDFLIKRLAYRIQELTYGGLSERTQEKLDDVLVQHGYNENAMLRNTKRGRPKVRKDHPIIGTVFIREWHGRRHEVKTLHDGFEYQGRKYSSLTAIATVITGGHRSGKSFFGLTGNRNS